MHIPDHDPDTISLTALGICAHVGVPEAERARVQRLELDVVMSPSLPLSGLGDRIAGTVDYAVVAERCREVALSRPRALIETLAEDLCTELLRSFGLKSVRITVRKFILPDCGSVSVSLCRLT
jgi:phosphoglycolate phosphatase